MDRLSGHGRGRGPERQDQALARLLRCAQAPRADELRAMTVPQLLGVPGIDYLIFDYLGEGAMNIFAKLQAVDPNSGFMTDFVDVHIGPHLAEMKATGVKVVANAGALNPRGLARVIRRRADELGVAVKVGVVEGDDLRHRVDELRREGHRDMFTGAPFPDNVASINAYL